MPRFSLPLLALGSLLVLAAPQPGSAEAFQPPDDPATLVRVGGDASDGDVRADGAVRFRNQVDTPTRLIFDRRDAEALQCATDGRRAIRSRPGQYVLAAGAEMDCTLREGSYRYEAYTQQGGAIEATEARLRIR